MNNDTQNSKPPKAPVAAPRARDTALAATIAPVSSLLAPAPPSASDAKPVRDLKNDDCVVVVVGPTNMGKSSVVCAMLGLAPGDSAVPVGILAGLTQTADCFQLPTPGTPGTPAYVRRVIMDLPGTLHPRGQRGKTVEEIRLLIESKTARVDIGMVVQQHAPTEESQRLYREVLHYVNYDPNRVFVVMTGRDALAKRGMVDATVAQWTGVPRGRIFPVTVERYDPLCKNPAPDEGVVELRKCLKDVMDTDANKIVAARLAKIADQTNAQKAVGTFAVMGVATGLATVVPGAAWWGAAGLFEITSVAIPLYGSVSILAGPAALTGLVAVGGYKLVRWWGGY